jgi:hypothetical protein
VVERLMAVGGLDLARRSDHSALVRLKADGPRLVVTHALRLPQIDYAAQIEALAPAVGDLARLAVDATGVGDPVVEMLRAALPSVALVPVVIGGGEAARRLPDGRWHVPKAILVERLREAMGLGLLTVNPAAPGRDDLRSELASFTATQRGRRMAMEAAVGHDDLVMALALATFAAALAPLAVGGPTLPAMPAN